MNYLVLGIAIIIAICLFALVFCMYMMSRNYSVYEFRNTLLFSNYNMYEKLPSYDTMMSYFWIPLYDLDSWTNFKYPECEGVFQAIRNYINYKN